VWRLSIAPAQRQVTPAKEVMTDNRRSQQIGRRELDLWREHQIARYEQMVTALEALAAKMTGHYNDHVVFYAGRLAAELQKHREAR
jgi:hypothetical protein